MNTEKTAIQVIAGACLLYTSSSRYKHSANRRKSFADLIGTGDKKEIVEYFSYIYADYPDVLTAGEVAEMTGFGKSTIFKLVKKGIIKTIPCPTAHRYLIPKAYLLNYLQTPYFIEAKSNSEMFKKILGGFEAVSYTHLHQCF